jgi:pimeloyl-ACP methyl ester carboxylesterase
VSKSAAKPQRALPQASPFQLKNETIEQWLRTGEQSGLLEDYFGAANYRSLREMSREASTRKVRGGPRVLILPGIMGSTLGRPRPLLDDVIWIDPVDVAEGHLTQLALSTQPSRVQALGVMLFTYLRLKLKVQMSGFDASFFPFDWRFSVDDLAKTLVRRLENETADEVHLVAHSMGGLVARAAIARKAPRVGRLIMLGTPNFGSFAPVQALRGTYGVVRKIAVVDAAHSAEELASRVFGTFPSLYEMMPAPEKFSSVDLTDPGNWPDSAPKPDAKLLKRAGGIQPQLAPSDRNKPFYMIAGVRQETVVGLRKGTEEFQYELSSDGDGTVPLNLAELPNAKMYYVEESHGSLPNNGTVCSAVADILGSGETSSLTTTRPGPTRARKVVGDSEIRRRSVETDAPRALSQREKRLLISEVASPESQGPQAATAAAAPSATPAAEQRFDHVVIGRRRQHRLDIKLVCGSITDVDARAYVLGIFRDVTPSGAASAVDARLEGAITEFTARRMFSGGVGEIFMMPAGRHSIRTDTILFAGLGPFDSFTEELQQLVAENVIRTLIRTRVEDFATVFVGGGSGHGTAAVMENMLNGFLRGLRDTDGDQRFRSITLCEIDRKRFAEIKAELYRLLSTSLFDEFEVTLDEAIVEPAPEPAFQRRVVASRDPVYLLVRREGAESKKTTSYRSSVLTAGEKATVVTNVKDVDNLQLEKHLAKLQSTSLDLDGMKRYGDTLGRMMLSDEVLTLLATMKDRHLVVVHDAESSRIPWETLTTQDWSPSTGNGVSRRYTADNLSIAKWLEQRRRDKTLNVLLVVNPTGDLPDAEAEGKRIQELAKTYPSVSLKVVRQGAATKAALLRFFQSGDFDLVHYAGHAFFDPVSPSRSGLLCAGKQVLSGRELAGLGNLPSLVFFNACEAGRIRKGVVTSKATTVNVDMRERVERSVGVAESFLRGGVANYVGTYWPVGDESASAFATTFYRELLKGAPIGSALVAARREVEDLGSIDWADYLHYGNFQFEIKSIQA